MQARITMMDASGVDMQVLSVTPQLPTTVGDAATAANVVRMGNDIYARLIRECPEPFMACRAMP